MAATDETKPAGIEFYGGYQVYSESGIDLTLLHVQLQRSVEVRWESNRRSLALIGAFRSAGQAARQCPGDSRSSKSLLDAATLVRQLTEHRVEFVVIGCMAMIVHGSAYVSEDLDVCYRRTPKNIAAVATALAPLHPRVRGEPKESPFRCDSPTIESGLNFSLATDCGDMDLLGEVTGIGTFDAVLAQSAEQMIYNLKVSVLSLDGLMATKRVLNRIGDRIHLLELEELKKLRDAAPPPENA